DHQWRAQLPDLVHVEQVYPDVTATRERADDRAQRTRGPPATADHLAEIIRVHPDLEDPAPAQSVTGDTDIVRVVHDALDQVLERFLEHLRRRRPGPRPRSRRSRRRLQLLARLRCLPHHRRSHPPWRQPHPCHLRPWPRLWPPRPWRPRPCRCPPRTPCPWPLPPCRHCPYWLCPSPRGLYPLCLCRCSFSGRCPWGGCPWGGCPWGTCPGRRFPWPPCRRPPPRRPASRQNGAGPPRPARRWPCRQSRP